MRFISKISLKYKIIGIILFTCVMVISVGFSIISFNYIRDIKEDIVTDITVNAKLIGEYCIASLSFGYPERAEEILAKLEALPHVTNGYLFDENDNLFGVFNRDVYISNNELPDLMDRSYYYFEGEYLNVIEPIVYRGVRYGTIYIRAQTNLREIIINQITIVFILMFALYIVAYFLANKLQQFISKPILELADFMGSISKSGDYSMRIAKRSNDEIGFLFDGFNDMLEQIHLRRQQRDKAEKALRESESKYRRLTENARDVIYRMSLEDGHYEYVSPASLELFGYEPEHFYKHNLFLVDLLHPAWQEYFEDEFNNTIRGGKNTNHEYQIIHRSGEVKWMYQRNVLIQDEDGLPFAIEGIITDITKRKKAEQSLKKLNFLLSEKNNELEQIVYVTSHDLRSPLVNIQGFSSLLKDSIERLRVLVLSENISEKEKNEINYLLDEDMPMSFKFIHSSVVKMDSLLTGLLKLSRYGRIDMQIVDLDMNDMIRDITDNFKFRLDKKGCSIEISDLPPCRGDENQVNQVFSNLIDNAVKYLSSDRKGFITIKGWVEDEEAIYSIEDNGIGIAPEHKDQIFRIFFRLHPKMNDGIGLGMSIVKKIILRLKGRIWLESQLNQGSKFFIALPLAKTIVKE